MNKIAFILDFDHTLVNSNEAIYATKKKVSEALNINESLFEQTYMSHKEQYGFHFPYLHILFLTNNAKLINKGIKAYQTYYKVMKKAVFKDSVKAIKKLKKYGPVIIFSFGEREHQLKAICESGLSKYCDMVRVAEKKSIEEIDECIKRLKEKPNIIFSVGDRPSDSKSFKEYGKVKKVKIIGIRVRREQGKYSGEECVDGIVDKEYHNLVDFVADIEKGIFNL